MQAFGFRYVFSATQSVQQQLQLLPLSGLPASAEVSDSGIINFGVFTGSTEHPAQRRILQIQNSAWIRFIRTRMRVFIFSLVKIGEGEVTKTMRCMPDEKSAIFSPFHWGPWSDSTEYFTSSLFPNPYFPIQFPR